MENNGKKFVDKIKGILQTLGCKYKVRVIKKTETSVLQNGEKIITKFEKVIIYSGRTIIKPAEKRSRRLVARKNDDGEWVGDKDAIIAQGGMDGTKIYELDYHDKTVPESYIIYSDIWEDDEGYVPNYTKQKFINTMEKWKNLEYENVEKKTS